MTYFYMYLLTLIIDIKVSTGLYVIAGLGLLAGVVLYTLGNGDKAVLPKKSSGKLVKWCLIAILGLSTLEGLSPSKGEAVFIAVAGMAIDGEIHVKTIDLMAEALELSEEYVRTLKEGLIEDGTELIEEPAEVEEENNETN